MVTLIVLLTARCKKETDDSTPTPTPTYQNGFTIYGQFRETNQALFYNDNGTALVAFASSSLQLDTINGVWHGIGDGLDFEEMFSNTLYGVPVGNFTLNSSGATGSFSDGFMILNYDFDEDTGTDNYPITGNIDISLVSGNYFFQYNLMMVDSAIVQGTFYGQPVDLTSMIENKAAGLKPHSKKCLVTNSRKRSWYFSDTGM